MAWICPGCGTPDAIAYIENEDGSHPFPCLFCNHSVLDSGGRSTVWASHACAVKECAGIVRDLFHYSPRAGLTEVARLPCNECGAGKPRQAVHYGMAARRTR
ncbi:hypothetical protein [Streptomyces sp. NPDC093109]|uniref:hypothetical protein n=1 Tax=Streptomyces sp. NPDC093109 TaxID=3154977 RepID=UPI00344D3797